MKRYDHTISGAKKVSTKRLESRSTFSEFFLFLVARAGIGAVAVLLLFFSLSGVPYTGAQMSSTSTFSIVAYVPIPDDEEPPPGGGGGEILPPTELVLSGYAYSGRTVVFLKDGQYFAETPANASAYFSYMTSALSAGTYLFSIYSTDIYGKQSDLVNYTVHVTSNVRTEVSGIIVPPTVSVDNTTVKRGDPIIVSGQAVPNSTVDIQLDSTSTVSVSSVSDGRYIYTLDTTGLTIGTHTISARVRNLLIQSEYTQGTQFSVEGALPQYMIGDVNEDNRVNIVDFSIAAYWYKRPLDDAFRILEQRHLSGDGAVTLVDFSLMAFYWTG